MRRLVVATLAAFFSLFLIGTTSLVATASTAPSGYSCGYDQNQWNKDYDYYCSAKTTSNWWGTGMNNRASSAAANGAGCKYSRFYKSWNFAADPEVPYGDYFTLYSEQLVGSNYRDPQLSNGAGYDGAGEDFGNTVEATRFTGC